MSLNATLSQQLVLTLVGSNTFGTQELAINDTALMAAVIGSGTGVDKADQFYSVRTTLAASASATFALYAWGGAKDGNGNALTMAKVKWLKVKHKGNLNCTKVATATLNAAGTGYLINDVLTVAVGGGAGTACKITVNTVGGGGAILTATITAYQGYTGGSYSTSPTTLTANAVTGGTGTGATFNLTMATYTEGSQVFTDTDYLEIGNAAANPWTGLCSSGTAKLELYSGTITNPGELQTTQLGAGLAVAAGSNENLKFLNSGANPVTFDLYVIGATA